MIQDPALRINSGIWIIAFHDFMETFTNFTALMPNLSPISFFQADLDFRAGKAFREELSALVCQFTHDAEPFSQMCSTSPLVRIPSFQRRPQVLAVRPNVFVGSVFV